MGLFRPAGMPDHLYDFYQWTPDKRGLYESNYIKANSPDGRRALWIKHNILAPAASNDEAVAEIWCVLFEKGRRPRAIKETIAMAHLNTSFAEAKMVGEAVLISPSRSATRIEMGGKVAKWDIAFSPNNDPFGQPVVIYPWARLFTAPFPKKKVVTPVPINRWDGELVFDNEHIQIEGWTGFRNHNWGTEHAHRYAYGNCNLFDEQGDAFFEGFSAKLKKGPLVTPFISAGLLRLAAKDHAFSGLGSLVRARAEVSFPRWSMSLESSAGRLVWEQRADPDSFVCLRYHHPGGAESYCYNSKFAHTTLRFERNGVKAITLSSELGELEILEHSPRAGIEIHG
jgi:hypothetical protein